MVVGLDVFRSYFGDFPDHYVIIGGTACDVILSAEGLTPRATKDIDIILIVEALNSTFVAQFWRFIQDGNYERREESAEERRYYRFANPTNTEFPKQIELFARQPDVIVLPPEAHLTPIPVDDDLSSLSAILLNEEYYQYIIEHSSIDDGLRMAKTEALIALKAKAFLEMNERLAYGQHEDSKYIRKHKSDVYKLGVLLTAENSFDLSPLILSHMKSFMEEASTDLPAAAIFRELGAPGFDPKVVHEQIIISFKLND